MTKEEEINKFKSDKRTSINLSFLGICFSLFTFIIAINSKILQNNFLLAVELTLAIPFFLSSVFARTKLAHTIKPKMWDNFGFITFMTGYSFLLSVVGILLSSLVSVKVGMIFFTLNIIMALIYSTLEIVENSKKLKSRFSKDLFFIALIVIFGILPSLNVWNL